MKRILLMLFACLLLCGCSVAPNGEETSSAESTQDMTGSWIEEVGRPWDEEGALLEIPLTVPDGLHYSSVIGLNGDLLLWSVDDHLANQYILELCLVDLHDGSVVTKAEYSFTQYCIPQVLGDSVYLCDSMAGQIYKLDQNLECVQTWSAEPMEGSWYMGENETLYIYDWMYSVFARDLTTGEIRSVLPEEPYVEYFQVSENSAILNYRRNETGEATFAVVDLMTGQLHYPDFTGDFDSASMVEDDWLYGFYVDRYEYYLSVDGAEYVKIDPGTGTFELLDGKYLLWKSEDYTSYQLYDLNGKALSKCQLTATMYNYHNFDLIWSEEYQGYFCPVNSYDSGIRLLFWDISQGQTGEDLVFQPIPVESETDRKLKEKAQRISEAHGVNILVSNECDTVFDEFTASIADDYEQVSIALDQLDEALSVYPEGFFHQLRSGSVQIIEIQLVRDLMADGSGRWGSGYCAFTQSQWDTYLMVVDIYNVSDSTYYHEFSHIIDSHLEKDAMERENALYSEGTWASLNPSWFTGYTYDYSLVSELQDATSFVDSYATISPTEDRARVMEFAMVDYGSYTFENAEVLLNKLDYYSRCIRDAFDTTGWPVELPWEQHLIFG